MYDFEYHKPGSLADAVKLLSADPDARPISGGQTLLPALRRHLTDYGNLAGAFATERLRQLAMLQPSAPYVMSALAG